MSTTGLVLQRHVEDRTSKAQQRIDIERQVKSFLEKGGVIQQIPFGKSKRR